MRGLHCDPKTGRSVIACTKKLYMKEPMVRFANVYDHPEAAAFDYYHRTRASAAEGLGTELEGHTVTLIEFDDDLLDDIIQALANKRLIEKSIKDPVGAQLTTELLERVKAYRARGNE